MHLTVERDSSTGISPEFSPSNRVFFFLFADQRSLQPETNLFGGAMADYEKEFTSPFNAV